MWSPSAQLVAWNATGTQVVYTDQNGTALVVQNFTVVYDLSTPADYFAWSPDGNWLATYVENGTTVDIWQDGELYSKIILFADIYHVIADLSWDGDGQKLAILGRHHRVHWDVCMIL